MAQGLSRVEVARRASLYSDAEDFAPRFIEDLETRCQTVPAPEVLVPTCRALGLSRDVVCEVLGFVWP
jgi:hypothetical protein